MAIADGKPSILFCLPTALEICKPDIAMWFMHLGFELGQRGMVSKICGFRLRSSRILCNRNMFVEMAMAEKYDYICMVDPDMRPDLYARTYMADTSDCILETAKPFVSVALEFLAKYPFAVIAAPACCDPPDRKVNVFRAKDGKSTRVTHEEAHAEVSAPEPSIEQVAAIGTGLMMIPTAIFSALKRPFFDDEYADDAKTSPSRTQDIYFTENCSLSGIPVYCAWMCWAGHYKEVTLGCPGIDTQWAAKPAELKAGLTSIGPDASWQPPITLARAGG